MKHPRPTGFIALMSAIIISVVLLLVVTTSSFTGFYSRFNSLDAEFKARSAAAADACADIALLALAQGSDPSGRTVSLNSFDQCQIGIVSGGSQKIFQIQATSSDAVTNLEITINTSNLSIISWQEIPTF